jgi:hypothetical protein
MRIHESIPPFIRFSLFSQVLNRGHMKNFPILSLALLAALLLPCAAMSQWVLTDAPSGVQLPVLRLGICRIQRRGDSG